MKILLKGVKKMNEIKNAAAPEVPVQEQPKKLQTKLYEYITRIIEANGVPEIEVLILPSLLKSYIQLCEFIQRPF